MSVEDLVARGDVALFLTGCCVVLGLLLAPLHVVLKLALLALLVPVSLVPLRVRAEGDLGSACGLFSFCYWRCYRVESAVSIPPFPKGEVVLLRLPDGVFLVARGRGFCPWLARRRLRLVLEEIGAPWLRLAPAPASTTLGFDASPTATLLSTQVALVVADRGRKAQLYVLRRRSGNAALLPARRPKRAPREPEWSWKRRLEDWERAVCEAWERILREARPPLPQSGVVVGHTATNRPVRVPGKVHVAVFGQTGSGKTNLLRLFSQRLAKEEGCVVVVDFTGEYARSLKEYGFAVTLPPDPLEVYTPTEAVEAISTFAELYFAGERGVLSPMVRSLILEACEHCYRESGRISTQCVARCLAEARATKLREDEVKALDAALNRVAPLLYEYAPPPRARHVVVDLSGYPPFTQAVIADSILARVFKAARARGGFPKPVTVVIDEAHRIAKGRVVSQYLEKLLAEGRGYNVRLVIATQDPRQLASTAWLQAAVIFVFSMYDAEPLRGTLPREALEKIPSLPPGRAVVYYKGAWEIATIELASGKAEKGVHLQPRYIGVPRVASPQQPPQSPSQQPQRVQQAGEELEEISEDVAREAAELFGVDYDKLIDVLVKLDKSDAAYLLVLTTDHKIPDKAYAKLRELGLIHKDRGKHTPLGRAVMYYYLKK